MSEFPSDSSVRVEKGQTKIDSPIKMARALGFTQNPESLHSPFRDYAKDFPKTNQSILPAEKTLASYDSKYGEAEQVSVGAQFKDPCQIWKRETSVVSCSFLDWFVENGGNPQLAQEVRLLEDKAGWDWIDKKVMREKGYRLITQIIKQAEDLGYFRYQLDILSDEFERKKTIAEAGIKTFLGEFPEYSFLYNRFKEEGAFYAAKPAAKKERLPSMKIIIIPQLDSPNDVIIEFQLGRARIDEEGNLVDFYKVDPPVLPSTGKYQQRWFKGNMREAMAQAILARKRILFELHR